MRISVLPLLFLLGFTILSGCGGTRVNDLEQRVAVLERNVQTMEKRYAERQARLGECVDVDAENAYWGVLQTKGKVESPGVYRAPRAVWLEAREQKSRKI